MIEKLHQLLTSCNIWGSYGGVAEDSGRVGDEPLCHWVSSYEQFEGLQCPWSLIAAHWSWRCYSASKYWQLRAQNTALHSRRLELPQYSPMNLIKSFYWSLGSFLQSKRGKKEDLTWRLFVSVHQWPCVSALAIGLFFPLNSVMENHSEFVGQLWIWSIFVSNAHLFIASIAATCFCCKHSSSGSL